MASPSSIWNGVGAWLPRGQTLPDDIWNQRHRVIIWALWLHVPLLLVVAFLSDTGNLEHRLAEVCVPLSATLLVAHKATSRSIRTAATTFGLMTCSALLVHLTGGLVEVHFHFFAMLALLVLYQAWIVIGISVGYVAAHHGIMGAINPETVWSNAADIPVWQLTALHAGLVGVACVGHVTLWRHNEIAQCTAEEATKSALKAVEETKSIALQLADARDEALAASRMKSEFLANMSHEIRTPMNGVIGVADLLNTTSLTEEQKDYLNTIRTSGEALLKVLNDVLDLSKVEAGKLDVVPGDVDIRDIINNVVALFTPAAQQKLLLLTADIDTAVPFHLRGDGPRLRQILMNITGNAVKFTEQGKISIACHYAAGTLSVEVRDTGPGISEDMQTNVFESFSQGDTSSTRRHGGTGLGLTISKRLVELMDGTIELESTSGVGAAFRINVPMEIIYAKASPPKKIEIPEAEVRISDDKQRVLLAEDNHINQQVAKIMLESLGYTVDVVNNGSEALEAIAQNNYAAALMDCQMSVMDGYEATRQIRRAEQDSSTRLPIIAFTAHAMSGDSAKCFAAGMDDYLPKPIRMEDVQRVMSRWTHIHPAANG